MHEQNMNQPRGILDSRYFKDNFVHNTFSPRHHLKDYVEHYWLVSWQLPDNQDHEQSVIPHPNTHLTFLKNGSHIQGIHKGKFSHVLKGEGNIIGIKFKPAGFYHFAAAAGLSMREICNQSISIDAVFDIETSQVEQHVLCLEDDKAKILFLEDKLFTQAFLMSEADKNMLKINYIIESIVCDQQIMKVSDICGKFSIEARALQRLFEKYVGVSAKWVINRYRIHDVLMNIENNHQRYQQSDWANLATKLGYFDQAHFIHDFKALIGQTPKSYERSLCMP